MKKIKWLLSICMMIVLLIAAGCGGTGGNNKSGTGQTGSPIEIGYVGGLSGGTAAFGVPIYDAVEYAIEEINKSGGINGAQLNLSKADDEGNPFKGQQAIDKFASQKVSFVISGSSSAVALSEVPKVKQNNMIVVSPVATDPAIQSADPNFFVNITNNNQLGGSIASYTAKELNIKEVIAFVRDDAYGKSIYQAFKNKGESQGMKVVQEFSYPIDNKDFNSYISQGLKAYPEAAIMLTGYAADSGLIAKQARALGYTKTFLASNPIQNQQFIEVAGTSGNNSVFSVAYFAKDNVSSITKQFIDKWNEKKGKKPDVYQVHGYDAMYLLKNAIEQAGNTDPAKVKAKLLTTKDYDGVAGKMSFNPDGSVTKTIYIVKWNNGQLQLEKELNASSY